MIAWQARTSVKLRERAVAIGIDKVSRSSGSLEILNRRAIVFGDGNEVVLVQVSDFDGDANAARGPILQDAYHCQQVLVMREF